MAFAHNGVRWILGGWTGFLAENLILSHNRDEIIERFGADRYHFLYNSLSSITTLSIAYGYFRYGRGAGPVVAGFENVSPALRQFSSFALQALGLIGFSQMAPKLQIPVIMKSSTPQSESSASSSVAPTSARFQSRCPIDFASAKRPAGVDPDAPYGLERITRHPQLWSLAFLGLGSAIASPFVAERVLFGFPTVMALVGGAHQDYRFRNNSGGSLTPAREAVTSLLPFGALLTGAQSWSSVYDESKGLNAAVATLLAACLAVRRGRVPAIRASKP